MNTIYTQTLYIRTTLYAHTLYINKLDNTLKIDPLSTIQTGAKPLIDLDVKPIEINGFPSIFNTS